MLVTSYQVGILGKFTPEVTNMPLTVTPVRLGHKFDRQENYKDFASWRFHTSVN